jgi:hypothetical protein
MRLAWMVGAASAVLLPFGCEHARGESEQLSAVTIVGRLDYGQTSGRVKAGARYGAFKFSGNKGDQVAIDVASPNGDANAWLTDQSFKVLSHNDNDGDSTDSHIDATLPDSSSYFVVFGQARGDDATFHVSLKKQ